MIILHLACLAGAKRGRGRGKLGARDTMHWLQALPLSLATERAQFPPLASLSSACHAGYLRLRIDKSKCSQSCICSVPTLEASGKFQWRSMTHKCLLNHLKLFHIKGNLQKKEIQICKME